MKTRTVTIRIRVTRRRRAISPVTNREWARNSRWLARLWESEYYI